MMVNPNALREAEERDRSARREGFAVRYTAFRSR